jgi:glycosyltransferase involved in cell wall biosynthesis
VANSDALRTALADHIPAEKLVTSYPPVDRERVRLLADQPVPTTPFTLPAADLTVTVVGRITRTKGQWRVIEAIGRLRARGVRVAACFVGVTVEADADVLLARRAKRLGVADAITFVGEQVNPFPYVRAADVGVTASDIEAFGRTTFEYMTLGRPVIASRSGGSAELVVDGETGYLVDADDIDALAARMETLAHDRALRSAMGSAGRERAESLITSGDVDRIVELLTEAATRDVPRLPSTVVAWLEVPELFGPSRESVLRALVRVRHFGRRVAEARRHPWATLRRRWLRSRRLSDRAGRPPAGPQLD